MCACVIRLRRLFIESLAYYVIGRALSLKLEKLECLRFLFFRPFPFPLSFLRCALFHPSLFISSPFLPHLPLPSPKNSCSQTYKALIRTLSYIVRYVGNLHSWNAVCPQKAVDIHLLARMKARKPNKKPHSQKTKHDKTICGMNVSFTRPLPVIGGSTTCPVLASRTT